MRNLLRKLFLLDWNPQRIIVHIPDKIKLTSGSQKLKLRRIKSLVKPFNISNNFYKNFEFD
jgi:hypothetical protein